MKKTRRKTRDPWNRLEVTESGCHPWTGSKSAEGYPVCKVDGKIRSARRVIWERVHGPIPDGVDIHNHSCRNLACVNVEHLELAEMGTVTMCKAGHERIRGEVCAACSRAYQAAWRAANPERFAEIQRKSREKREPLRLRVKGKPDVYWDGVSGRDPLTGNHAG